MDAPVDAAVCIAVKLASGSPVPQFVLQREAARLNHRRPDAQPQQQPRTSRSSAADKLRRLFVSSEQSKRGTGGPKTTQSSSLAHPTHVSLSKDTWWSLTLIPVEDDDESSSSIRGRPSCSTKLPPISTFDIAREAAQSKIKALQQLPSMSDFDIAFEAAQSKIKALQQLPSMSDFDIAFEAAQSKIKALQQVMSLPPASQTQ